VTITRDHLHPAQHREVSEEEVMKDRAGRPRAEEVTVRQEPKAARMVTYPHPDGPSFVSTGELLPYPYGEDPLDPTTHLEPRRQTTGMIGRLHPKPMRRRS